MITTKTPYRIPLSGGGTDVNFYYKNFGSRFLSAAISEYVYVSLLERKLDNNHMIQTSTVEFSKTTNQIKHSLIRETIKYFNLKEKLQISIFSTVPTSTGLGTSSAMVVGLINCIKKFKNIKLSKYETFKTAYNIERKICGFAGGWQDQIVSEFGGLIDVSISKKESISVLKTNNTSKIKKIINNHFFLVYSKKKRNSSMIIKSQMKNFEKTNQYYNEIKKLNSKMVYSINKLDTNEIGNLFNYHWKLKRDLTKDISNSSLNNIFSKIQSIEGFLGGKLIGAGGGGFFLIIVKNKKKSLNSMIKKKLNFVNLHFENNGSKILKN
jgi:D-glycero-alpha-D-manno-heptose-7-phosphate kinase